LSSSKKQLPHTTHVHCSFNKQTLSHTQRKSTISTRGHTQPGRRGTKHRLSLRAPSAIRETHGNQPRKWAAARHNQEEAGRSCRGWKMEGRCSCYGSRRRCVLRAPTATGATHCRIHMHMRTFSCPPHVAAVREICSPHRIVCCGA